MRLGMVVKAQFHRRDGFMRRFRFVCPEGRLGPVISVGNGQMFWGSRKEPRLVYPDLYYKVVFR